MNQKSLDANADSTVTREVAPQSLAATAPPGLGFRRRDVELPNCFGSAGSIVSLTNVGQLPSC
jgi:hypothetical protein